MTTELMLFTGRFNPTVACSIARRLKITPGAAELEIFGNGEAYCRY